MEFTELVQAIEQFKNEGRDMSAVIAAASASGKTLLGLNQWQLTDKPRMEQFNADNRIIDEKLQEITRRPVEYAIPFANGFEEGSKSTYFKTREGVVHLRIDCKRTDGKDIQNSTAIAALPAGFRPNTTLMFPCLSRAISGHTNNYGHVYINYQGAIQVQFSPVTQRAYFSVSYLAHR